MTPSESSSIAAEALIAVAPAFLLLSLFTAAFLIRQFIILPKVTTDFIELHRRRVARARRALAYEEANDHGGSTTSCHTHAHPFSAWLSLGPGGTVTIAGETFGPGESYAVTARDANNIPRARAASTGQEVYICSHGQNYRAKFTGTEWNVQLVGEGQL